MPDQITSQSYDENLWTRNLTIIAPIGPCFILVLIAINGPNGLGDNIIIVTLLVGILVILKIIIPRQAFSFCRTTRINNGSVNSPLVKVIEKSLVNLEIQFTKLSDGKILKEWPLIYTEIFKFLNGYFIAIEQMDDKSIIIIGRSFRINSFLKEVMNEIDSNIGIYIAEPMSDICEINSSSENVIFYPKYSNIVENGK